jgi:hypothetical protein
MAASATVSCLPLSPAEGSDFMRLPYSKMPTLEP